MATHATRQLNLVSGFVLAMIAILAGAPGLPTTGVARRVIPPVSSTPIQHVVIILKENRSFDQYFGRFPNLVFNGVDYGATTAKKSDGSIVDLAVTPDPLPNDIDHSNGAWKKAYNGGQMNGFDREKGAYSSTGQPLALSQMSKTQIPNYWAYARKYALGARMFASWKGASFGNNLFEVAAQAGQYDSTTGCVPNPAMPGTEACHTGGRSVYTNPISPIGPGALETWGCDDPVGTYSRMIAANGATTSMFPCFRFPSLPDVLSTQGLTWRFYVDPVGKAKRHNGLNAIASIRNDVAQWANVRSDSGFLSDARNGTLPAVSWVQGLQNEHPVRSACEGENQTVEYVNAVMSGPDWASTAIFVVWDEWGGFYDHIRPPQIDFVQYGFRVPLLVISPYTKRQLGPTDPDPGYVSFTTYSHASLLKFAEVNWGLPSLTPADARANDMMGMFNFSATPKSRLILAPRTCPELTPEQKALIHRTDWD